MAKQKKKAAVGIGVCSEHYRPQKYATRDPYPCHPFYEPKLRIRLGLMYLLAGAAVLGYALFS